jgi:hypothetical protein
MRKIVPFLMLFAAAGCGAESDRAEQQSSQDLKTYDTSESPPPPPAAPPMEVSSDSSARMSAPAISPSAAPGVAFNYRYAFRLQGERISAVQEQHAAACEKLGLDRCRITGMRYRLVNERDVEAMLAFKLDPAIARAFGKRGIEAVAKADGMLVDSEISGVDVGTQIDASTRTEARLEEDLRRIEQQLARPGLRAGERVELQQQAQQLRESIRANQTGREENRESLARTPVVFSYGSGDLVPGFDSGPRFRQAIERAGNNLLGSLVWMFVALITLLPWALLVFLAWRLWRFLSRRYASGEAPVSPAEE